MSSRILELYPLVDLVPDGAVYLYSTPVDFDIVETEEQYKERKVRELINSTDTNAQGTSKVHTVKFFFLVSEEIFEQYVKDGNLTASLEQRLNKVKNICKKHGYNI